MLFSSCKFVLIGNSRKRTFPIFLHKSVHDILPTWLQEGGLKILPKPSSCCMSRSLRAPLWVIAGQCDHLLISDAPVYPTWYLHWLLFYYGMKSSCYEEIMRLNKAKTMDQSFIIAPFWVTRIPSLCPIRIYLHEMLLYTRFYCD